MQGQRWTKKELKFAVETLGRCDSQQEAVRHLNKALPHRARIQATNLVAVFETNGLKHPREYVRKPEFDARSLPEIVKKQKAEAAEAKLRREYQNLLDQYKESEQRLEVMARLRTTPVTPKVVARERGSGLREGTAVALASDWHVEEVVYPDAVAGRNEYNLRIADARQREFFRRVRSLVEFSRGSWKVRDLVLWLGGDLLTGYIHPELEESNELSPVEALIWLRERLVGGIDFLLRELKLERLVVPSSYGNHGRITEKRRIKTGAKNSFEWLLYQWLAAHYASDKRVMFEASQSAHQYVETYGYTIHFHHGDELKYGGGVGGLAIPLNKRVPRWANVRPSRYHNVGHFHQLLDLGHTQVNGSLIGYTEYAMAIGADFELPQQAFYLLDSKNGKCLNAPIWVEKQ